MIAPDFEGWRQAEETLSTRRLPPFARRIRDLGRIDRYLHDEEREIVRDMLAGLDGGYRPIPGGINRMAQLDRAFALSNMWLAELFEIVRILDSRIFPRHLTGAERKLLKSLKKDLALVRTPLSKFRIAGTNKFIHYPKSVIGDDRSFGWRVTGPDMNEYTFTRRQFAQRFLDLSMVYAIE